MTEETKKYRNKVWFSLNSLAEQIAQYNHDGRYDKTAWNFWRWLDRKCNPKSPKV